MNARLRPMRRTIATLVAGAALLPAARADDASAFVVARGADVAVVRIGGGGLVIVDIDDGALLQRVFLGENLAALDIAPGGDLVAAWTARGTLVLWQWRAATLARSEPFGLVSPAEGRSGRQAELLFAPDGERVLVRAVGDEAKVVARDGAVLGTLHGVRGLWLNRSLAWDAQGERIVYTDKDGLSVVDARTLAPLRTESGAEVALRPTSRIDCFELHPTAPRVATGHADGRMRVTDLATGDEVQVLEHDDPMWGLPPKEAVTADPFFEFPSIGWLAHSRDGSRLAYTTVSGVHLGCFDLARGELVALSPFAGGRMGTPAPIAWGPRDRRVFYAFWGGNRTLPWVWFGAGQRYGEVAVPGCVPKFGAGTTGVFLSDGRLRALDGITGELLWTVEVEALSDGELQPPR